MKQFFSLNALKRDLKDLEDDAHNFIAYLKTHKITVLLIIFFVLLSYGMKVFYYFISIDTEAIINNSDYLYGTWTGSGRFGLVFTKWLFGIMDFNPYLAGFLMATTMILFCISWSFVLHSFAKPNSSKFMQTIISVIFPIVFVTAPLFAEQFIFILQAFEVAFGILLCSWALFFAGKWTLYSYNILYLLLACVLSVWTIASYQAVVFMYISGAMGCFLLQYYGQNNRLGGKGKQLYYLKIAFKYLAVFCISFSIYLFIDKIVLKTGQNYYLGIMKTWGQIPVEQSFSRIVDYFQLVLFNPNGTSLYSKLFLLVACGLFVVAIYNFFSKRQEKILAFIACCGLLISPFILSIYLGGAPQARMQFSLPFVTAFGLYFIFYIGKGKFFQRIGLLLSVIIAFWQGTIVSQLMYTDYMKYQNEIAMVQEIATRVDVLMPEDGSQSTPVVFIGVQEVQGTPSPLKGDSEIGVSFFQWDYSDSFGNNPRIHGLMRTVGRNYVSPSKEQFKIAQQYATEAMSIWPSANSIQILDDMIVVRLS